MYRDTLREREKKQVIMMNYKLVSDSSSNVYTLSGAKKAVSVLVDMLGERGYEDGKLIRVAHCFGEENANAFKAAVLAKYPNANFVIEHTTGLCSFYAEAGGLMIGFEGGYNTNNNNNEH